MCSDENAQSDDFANNDSRVCLSRIVQFVYTVRLDYNDITWSNVDVAIWNLVESHIGAVAANIPLLGPLITLLLGRFRTIVTTISPGHGQSGQQSSSEHVLGNMSKPEHRFRRIDEDGSKGEESIGLSPPDVGRGSSILDQHTYKYGDIMEGGIKVKTHLSQEHSP